MCSISKFISGRAVEEITATREVLKETREELKKLRAAPVITPEIREQMAHAMCVAEGVDPDKDGFGMGHSMPKGTKYKLWEARLSALDAALAVLQSGGCDASA